MKSRSCRTLPLLVALVVLACNRRSSGSGADSTSSESDSGDQDSSSEHDPSSDDSSGDRSTLLPELDDSLGPECDALLQDCPEGEKCVPTSSFGGAWDAHECVPVIGDQAPGEPCTYDGTAAGTDTCDESGWCWDVMDVDGQAIGTCSQFCNPMSDDRSCPPGFSCGLLHSLEIALCFPQCNPITQDCGAGLGCFWVNDAFNCVFTSQDIPAGEPCGFINDCVAGSACLEASLFPACAGESCCAAFCDIGLGDAQCELVPGTSCVPFFAERMTPVTFEHVGVCVTP